MKRTKLLFSTTNDLVSRVIRAFTWSDFSHVDVIYDDQVLGAMPGQGVLLRPIEERISESSAILLAETMADQDDVINLMLNERGKAYDWSAVLGIGTHRDWREDDKWFCSELVADVHRRLGVHLVNPNLQINRVTPQMLLESPQVSHKRLSH